MSTKHIYWFSYYNLDEPSVRYRAKYVLEELNSNHSISYDLVIPSYQFNAIIKFIIIYFEVLIFRKSHSIIVFQKLYSRGFYSNLLKFLVYIRKERTIYDIDDADYTRKPADTMHYFMRNCKACTVGSIELKNYVHKYNQNIHLLTSPIIKHEHVKTQKENIFTIGWVGYYGAHRASLMNYAFPAIRNISFELKLKLLGVKNEQEEIEIKNYFKTNPLIQLDIPMLINWHDELSIYKQIKSFDIGISPLQDTEFNRAKSAFKLKQYMSCGVPVIASNVGENTNFIVHGVNGYLCKSIEDFNKYIYQLKHINYFHYNNLSTNAYLSRNNFSIDLFCKSLLNIFN